MRRYHVKNLVQIALIASLYVVLSLCIAPFSYGPIQIRLSEMLNLLVIYDKKYIYAVTLGCALANLASPYGIVDVIFGSASTFVTLWICYIVIRNMTSFTKKIWSVVIIATLSMVLIASELYVLASAPFWMTYLTVAIGEFISLGIGAIILLWLNHNYPTVIRRWLT